MNTTKMEDNRQLVKPQMEFELSLLTLDEMKYIVVHCRGTLQTQTVI